TTLFRSDPVFMDRLKSVSPKLAKLGNKLPSENDLKEAMVSGELAAPVSRLIIEEPKTKVEIHLPDKDEQETVTEFTAEDAEKIESFSVEDFDLDFDDIEIPDGNLDGEAVDNAVDEFLSKISA